MRDQQHRGPSRARRWPRELLVVLMVAPPVLALVFEPDGLRHEIIHQARSLAAIWIYVMSLGFGIQVVTDATTERWPCSLDGRRGGLQHLLLVMALVVFSTLLLSVPLEHVCPGLQGKTTTLMIRGVLLSVVYVLIGRRYQASVRAREEELAARAAAEQQLAEARYSALVSRTQPHFLHNALATAAGLVPSDPSAAQHVLRDLGALFREVTIGTDRRFVRAAEEWQTASRYLRVQQARFASRLAVEMHAEPLAADELVPPLVLLPFVENAVLHGLSDGAPTRVRLTLGLEREHVVLAIEDDGPGMGRSSHADGSGVGLKDVQARLAQLYGRSASVTTRPARAHDTRPGLVAEVRIPREQEES